MPRNLNQAPPAGPTWRELIGALLSIALMWAFMPDFTALLMTLVILYAIAPGTDRRGPNE
jgi:hypothetical protein